MNINHAAPAAKVRKREELRRSGAAGAHGDRRLKRQKTRSAQKRAYIKEYA